MENAKRYWRVCPSRKKQESNSRICRCTSFLLSMLPEMPLGEFIELISIKIKEYKRNTWVTQCNLPSLSIGAAEQLAWPLLINVMITERFIQNLIFTSPAQDTQTPFVSSSHSPVQPAAITYILESASANRLHFFCWKFSGQPSTNECLGTYSLHPCCYYHVSYSRMAKPRNPAK